MKQIAILGAGLSSPELIKYLVEQAGDQWKVLVGDISLDRAAAVTPHGGTTIIFDVLNPDESVIEQSDVVISLLPPAYHETIAKLCLKYKKHLLTASYESDGMRALKDDVSKLSLLFLNECGLDPGIDHMSAMMIIHEIEANGGKVHSFESFAGAGLIPSDVDVDNPWRYKFSWNPHSVVTAGQQGLATCLIGGDLKYISYGQLFERISEINVPGVGHFQGYANRDSLHYRSAYGLDKVDTLLRGTLRFDGYCAAWNVLARLGCTNAQKVFQNVQHVSHRSFLCSFLKTKDPEKEIAELFGLKHDDAILFKLKWSGFFSDELIGLSEGTPAQITQHILNKRWALQNQDKDMIVMWHRFGYSIGSKRFTKQSWFSMNGDDHARTAIAKTVGLPLAIAAKLLVQNQLTIRGVHIPTIPEIYTPILQELELVGIRFLENTEVDHSR